jgi:putative DNA primase/helicase
MPDANLMFEPLSMEERTGGTVVKSDDKTPIIPVPADAPPMRFRHPKYGYPTAEYAYHVASGELAGYACRFDFIDEDGKPDKLVLPVTYCDLGNGRRDWRSKGIPAPRPLYRLHDINARPDAPVLICEGEKATNAGVPIFPECVPTTPMHGAKSPHLADWTPLAGRTVVIWSDNDPPGRDFAQKVAELVTKAGAAAVSIVQVPHDWPAKWDLADPLPEGVDQGDRTNCWLPLCPGNPRMPRR